LLIFERIPENQYEAVGDGGDREECGLYSLDAKITSFSLSLAVGANGERKLLACSVDFSSL